MFEKTLVAHDGSDGGGGGCRRRARDWESGSRRREIHCEPDYCSSVMSAGSGTALSRSARS